MCVCVCVCADDLQTMDVIRQAHMARLSEYKSTAVVVNDILDRYLWLTDVHREFLLWSACVCVRVCARVVSPSKMSPLEIIFAPPKWPQMLLLSFSYENTIGRAEQRAVNV